MVLIKLLLMALVAFLAWRAWRLFVPRRDAPKARPPAEDMARCALCELHVPRGSAVAGEDRLFCCEEHRREYLERGGGKGP